MHRGRRAQTRWKAQMDELHVRISELDKKHPNLSSYSEHEKRLTPALRCGSDEGASASRKVLDCGPECQSSGLLDECLKQTVGCCSFADPSEPSTDCVSSADSAIRDDGSNADASQKTSACWADLVEDSTGLSNASCMNDDPDTLLTLPETSASECQCATAEDESHSQISSMTEDHASVASALPASPWAVDTLDHGLFVDIAGGTALEVPAGDQNAGMKSDSALGLMWLPCVVVGETEPAQYHGNADPEALLTYLSGQSEGDAVDWSDIGTSAYDVPDSIAAEQTLDTWAGPWWACSTVLEGTRPMLDGNHTGGWNDCLVSTSAEIARPWPCISLPSGATVKTEFAATFFEGSPSECEGAWANGTIGAEADSPADADGFCSFTSSDNAGVHDGIRTPSSDDQDAIFRDELSCMLGGEDGKILLDLFPDALGAQLADVDCAAWAPPSGPGTSLIFSNDFAEDSHADRLHMIRAAQAAAVAKAQKESQHGLAAGRNQKAKKKAAKSDRAKTHFGNQPAVSRRICPMDHQSVPKPTKFAEASELNSQAMTTLMVRNIPNRYTRKMLIAEFVKLGFEGLYDFLYLPLDRSTGWNVGYAFVNFINSEITAKCRSKLEGHSFRRFAQPRVALVSPAYLQGLERNLKHYRDSAVQCCRAEYRRPLFVEGRGTAKAA